MNSEEFACVRWNFVAELFVVQVKGFTIVRRDCFGHQHVTHFVESNEVPVK